MAPRGAVEREKPIWLQGGQGVVIGGGSVLSLGSESSQFGHAGLVFKSVAQALLHAKCLVFGLLSVAEEVNEASSLRVARRAAARPFPSGHSPAVAELWEGGELQPHLYKIVRSKVPFRLSRVGLPRPCVRWLVGGPGRGL